MSGSVRKVDSSHGEPRLALLCGRDSQQGTLGAGRQQRQLPARGGGKVTTVSGRASEMPAAMTCTFPRAGGWVFSHAGFRRAETGRALLLAPPPTLRPPRHPRASPPRPFPSKCRPVVQSTVRGGAVDIAFSSLCCPSNCRRMLIRESTEVRSVMLEKVRPLSNVPACFSRAPPPPGARPDCVQTPRAQVPTDRSRGSQGGGRQGAAPANPPARRPRSSLNLGRPCFCFPLASSLPPGARLRYSNDLEAKPFCLPGVLSTGVVSFLLRRAGREERTEAVDCHWGWGSSDSTGHWAWEGTSSDSVVEKEKLII